MKSIADIRAIIEDFEKYAAEISDKEFGERDLYEKIRMRHEYEQWVSKISILEWVLSGD